MFRWLQLDRVVSNRWSRKIKSQASSADIDSRLSNLVDALGNRGALKLIRKKDQRGRLPQAKIQAVGPADPQEVEADAVARAVVGSTKPSSSSRQVVENPTSSPGPHEASVGTGRPLPEAERAYFEWQFGQDFGDVRIRTDAAAQSAAQAMRARAFTIGRDVSFARGQYAPGTRSGRQLLAHELTHVVQQREYGLPHVQRATEEDFHIGGRFLNSQNFPDTVFFDYSSANLETYGDEAWKLRDILRARPSQLTLYGFASEEGDPEFNRRLVEHRLTAVERLLREWPPDPTLGFRGPIHRVPLPTARRGEIYYRRWRAVQVQVPNTERPLPSCEGEAIEHPCPAEFWAVNLASLDLVDNAIRRLDPSSITSDDRDTLELLFGRGIDPADVIERLQWIRGHIEAEVSLLPRLEPGLPQERVVCATRCNPDCGSETGAVASGEGETSIIVLCPGFFESSQAASLLLHEASHATPGMRSEGYGTADLAYPFERVIAHLGPLGLENAGSFELLARILSGEIIPLGLGEPDISEGTFNPPERFNAVGRAVALARSWARMTNQDIDFAYGEMHRIIAGEEAEFSASSRETVERIDDGFGITRSAEEDPVDHPLETHAWRLAAINHRYLLLISEFSQRFTFGQLASGSIAYSQGRYGPVLRFGPAFFALSEVERVRELLWYTLAHTPEEISPGLLDAYVNFADDCRMARGLPP